jgi:hypothetical protein
MPKSGQVQMVPGPMVPAAPAEVGETARYVLERELAILGTEQRDSKAEGIESGHGLNVAAALAQAMNRQVPEAVRQTVEFVGEAILEIACAMKRRYGEPVPIEVNQEIEPGADSAGEAASKWRTIEIQDRWVGGVYKLTATYPAQGNIAEQSLELDMWQKGASTLEAVLEKKGVEQPQAEAAKIHAEQILVGTPEGKLTMLADFYRWRGQREKAEALELQLEQRLSPYGMPTSAMGGGEQPPPAPMQGQPPTVDGTQSPNYAASQRGGIVAGAMGTAALAADAMATAGMRP